MRRTGSRRRGRCLRLGHPGGRHDRGEVEYAVLGSRLPPRGRRPTAPSPGATARDARGADHRWTPPSRRRCARRRARRCRSRPTIRELRLARWTRSFAKNVRPEAARTRRSSSGTTAQRSRARRVGRQLSRWWTRSRRAGRPLQEHEAEREPVAAPRSASSAPGHEQATSGSPSSSSAPRTSSFSTAPAARRA